MKKSKKKITRFRPQIRSKHPSHNPFRQRGVFKLFPYKSVIRFGSRTDLPDTVTNGGRRIEVNTVEAIRNTSNKERMKRCFDRYNIKHLPWWRFNDVRISELPYPVVVKHVFHSRGRGLRKIDNAEQLRAFMNSKSNYSEYHIERYFSGTKEYRLHVSPHLEKEIFSIRKLRHQNEDGSYPWYFNSHVGCFVKDFEKPSSWANIVEECKKAVGALGMDIGAVDVRTNRNGNTFYIIEVNSAPGMGEITFTSYVEALTQIIETKRTLI